MGVEMKYPLLRLSMCSYVSDFAHVRLREFDGRVVRVRIGVHRNRCWRWIERTPGTKGTFVERAKADDVELVYC